MKKVDKDVTMIHVEVRTWRKDLLLGKLEIPVPASRAPECRDKDGALRFDVEVWAEGGELVEP